MSAAREFLVTLAQAISAHTLYAADHPSPRRAVDRAWEALVELQTRTPGARFTFLERDILYQGRPLPELGRWAWTTRLARAGVQRVELLGPVDREDLAAFVDELADLLVDRPTSTAAARPERPTNIRWGHAGLPEARKEPGEPRRPGEEEEAPAPADFDLDEEALAVEWLHDELQGGRGLQLLEAEALVRSLSVAMHGGREYLLPLLRLKSFDQYTTTHALNVSVLAMALSEFIGLEPAQVRSFGLAGLLHDLGKVTIPREILVKPGRLTEEERAVMNGHTVEGARLILQSDQDLDLAAVVAYEHHIKLDGGGYPSLRWPRACHQASDLVHVCDVFDALRTHRPYREAWEQDRVLAYLESGAGTEFDPELVHAFVAMMRTHEPRAVELESTSQALPLDPSPRDAERNSDPAEAPTGSDQTAPPPEG